MDDKQEITTPEARDDSIGKHRRRGGRGLIITTSVVLVLVIALNLIFSILSYNGLWFVDLTLAKYKSSKTPLFTLSEECIRLIGDEAIPMIDSINSERKAAGEESIRLNIIFCDEPDRIEENTSLRYVLYTARSLRREFPQHINIEFINMKKIPRRCKNTKRPPRRRYTIPTS